MNCPACLTGPLGVGFYAAFAVCALFFLIAVGALFWASKTGRLSNLEDTKYKMLQDNE